MFAKICFYKVLILNPNFHRFTKEYYPFSQYDSSLKINLTFNNIGQIGKQNIYPCTSAEYLLNLFIQLSCFYSHLLKKGRSLLYRQESKDISAILEI